MTNTKLIAQHIDLLTCEEKQEKICKICGDKTKKHFPQKKILSEKFNDYDICKCITSDIVCVHCASCIKDANLRRSCFYADSDKLVYFKKNDIENLVFNLQVKIPFVFCFTESFKKHNSFKANLNFSTQKYYIQAENEKILFDVEKLKPLYEIIKQAYFDDLLSKDEILTGNYTSLVDVQKLLNYDKVFKSHRGNKYFDFLVYMLNSETKNEILKQRKEELKNAKNKKKSACSTVDNGDVEQLRIF